VRRVVVGGAYECISRFTMNIAEIHNVGPDSESAYDFIQRCIRVAEEDYTDPYLVILAHPSVALAFKEEIEIPSDATSFLINGYPVVVSHVAALRLIVVGERYERDANRRRAWKRLKSHGVV